MSTRSLISMDLWSDEATEGGRMFAPQTDSGGYFSNGTSETLQHSNSTPESVPTSSRVLVVDFSMLSDEVLVNDLNNLDASLAVIVRSLEMVGRDFMGVSFSFINYPHNYLRELSQTIRDVKAGVVHADENSNLVLEFSRTQQDKQVYHGDVVPIPNAGFWPGGEAIAMKTCELNMTFPKLMQKRRTFTLQFAEISRVIDSFNVEISESLYRKTKFSHEKRISELLSSHQLLHGIQCNPHHNPEIVESHKQCAEFSQNAIIHFIAQQKKSCAQLLEDTRIAQQELRQITMLVSKCSPAMTTVLRGQFIHNMQLAEPFTINVIKKAWEDELELRCCA